MTGAVRIPARIGAEAARSVLSRLDWPGCFAASPVPLNARLLWAPFTEDGACAAADERWRSVLAPAGKAVRERAPEAGMAAPAAGDLLPAAPGKTPVYLPVWIFRSGDGRDWMAVEAAGGSIVAGSIPAVRAAAWTRLLFLAGLALFTVSVSAGILLSVLNIVVSGLRFILMVNSPMLARSPVGSALILAACLPGLWWFTRKIPRVVARALDEPTARVATGRIAFPMDRSWLVLLERCGIAALVLAPFQLFTALGPGAHGAVSSIGAVFLILSFFPAMLMALFGWDAIVLSRGRWLPPAAPPTADPRPCPGRVQDMVQLGCAIALYAAAGGLIGSTVTLSGLGNWLPLTGMTPTAWFLTGAELGAQTAVLTAPLSKRCRGAILAGMIAGLAGRQFGSAAAGDAVAFFAVLAAGLTGAAADKGGQGQPPLDALRAALGFNLGAAAGRIAGRILGLFFLGGGFAVVGMLLFEHIAAAAGFLGGGAHQGGRPQEAAAGSPAP